MQSITSSKPLTPKQLLPAAGYPAGGWAIQGDINTTIRDVKGGKAYGYRFAARPQQVDLPALTASAAQARRAKPLKPPAGGEGRARIYFFTDAQIGKVDARRGKESGTPEFLARMTRIQAEISDDLRRRPVERAVVADGGDGIESVQNMAGQLFTSDLSEPQQVDLYSTVLHDLIATVHRRVPHLDVAIAPSNHARWRRGKEQLGRVGDDWGLTVHHMVKRQTAASGWKIRYHEPASLWEDVVQLRVLGHPVALHHGDQARPGSAGMAGWHAKKSAQGELAGVELLLTGHYHHLLLTSLAGGATWLQGPALDGGSSWFAQKGGAESDPGLAAIDITKHGGVDLGSLKVLTGRA